MECLNCRKELHRKDTYITIHKDGEEFEFCPNCREEAVMLMDWYKEFVSLNKDYSDTPKKTIVDEAKEIDFTSPRIERLKNVMSDNRNMIQMNADQYHDLIDEVESLNKALHEMQNVFLKIKEEKENGEVQFP